MGDRVSYKVQLCSDKVLHTDGGKKWMCSYASHGSQLPAVAWERQLNVTVDVSVIIWMQSTALIYWSGKMLDCKRNRIANNV